LFFTYCEQAGDVNQGERDEWDTQLAGEMRNVFKTIMESHGYGLPGMHACNVTIILNCTINMVQIEGISTLYRVIGLAYLVDPECYAGGSVATGRVSLAGQDEAQRSDEKRYPGPPGWELGRWTSTPTLAKNVV
jgi:hypothetical protein